MIKITESDLIICTEFKGPGEIVAISTNQDAESVLLYVLDCIEKAKKFDVLHSMENVKNVH